MGVWIETRRASQGCRGGRSHPVWVCGLKLQLEGYVSLDSSHTLYGCVD